MDAAAVVEPKPGTLKESARAQVPVEPTVKEGFIVNRETKLALLIGFVSIVVVTVLVGEHFGKARNATAATTELGTSTASAPAGASTPNLDPITSTPVGTPSAPLAPAGAGVTQPGGPSGTGTAGGPVQPIELTGTGAPAGAALSGAVLDRTRFIPAADLDGGHLTNGAALGGLPAGVTPVSTLGGLSPQASDTVGPAVGKPVSTGVEKMHPVLKGETLASIAQKYYGDKGLSKDLGAYNAKRLTAGGSVREGVTLRVPPKDVLLGTATLGLNAAGRSDVGSVPPGPARTKPSADKPAAGKATAGKPASRGPRTYTIKKGDTLTAIASRELGSAKRWEMLVAANPHLDEESLRPGMSIKIPASK